MIDANEDYLKKELDRQDRLDRIYSMLDESLQYDLNQISKHIDGMLGIIKEYEDTYNITIDSNEILRNYIEDLI